MNGIVLESRAPVTHCHHLRLSIYPKGQQKSRVVRNAFVSAISAAE
jgi:hypothetical protein